MISNCHVITVVHESFIASNIFDRTSMNHDQPLTTKYMLNPNDCCLVTIFVPILAIT